VALGSLELAARSLAAVGRRRAAILLASLFFLFAGYWLWFRDSSFARVNDVYVTGVDGPQARAIRSALEEAGLGMTTLHVKTADLRDAVANYPVVRSVTAQGDFPHKLTIEVQLNLPVAVVQSPSGRKPVAADGLVLSDVPITSGLPVVVVKSALPTERLTGGRAFQLVRLVGLAPPPLRARLTRVILDPKLGVVAQLRNGPELRFGDSSRLPAKWMAAARVLAAAGARGATYIDLRLPERPAAGGLSTTSVLPLAPAGEAVQQPPSGVVQNPQPQVQTSTQPSTQP
jgi:cell division protein FtsQ